MVDLAMVGNVGHPNVLTFSHFSLTLWL